MTFVKKAVKDANPTPATLAPVLASKAWQQAAGQRETAARLRRLPPGLTLGDEVGEPIFYDAARQLLIYRGFMCQASYLFLHKLSPDAEYEIAIDQLYVGTAADLGRRRIGLLLGVVAAVALAGLAVWFWLR